MTANSPHSTPATDEPTPAQKAAATRAAKAAAVEVTVPADAGAEITLTRPGYEPVVLQVEDGKVSAPDQATADQVVNGVAGAELVDSE